MFKKALLGFGVAGLLGVGSFVLAQSASQGGTIDKSQNSQTENSPNFDTDVSFWEDDNKIVGGINIIGTKQGLQEGNLINVIKRFLNRLLGLLSLVALVLLLFGGFKMLTAAGDETKFKGGMKILIQSATGLAIIGLSRFIVSIIFRIISNSTKT